MGQGEKRAAPDQASGPGTKKAKKSWRTPNKNGVPRRENAGIKPGDAGIWITCHKNKERKCIGEMKDLLSEYTGHDGNAKAQTATATEEDPDGSADDIEKEINQEVSDIRTTARVQPFDAVYLDVPCVIFFRIKSPSDPVDLTQRIVSDAAANPSRKRTRCTLRLEPSTMTGYADEEGLERLAKEVLAPHFHVEAQQPKKFAIRPTIRNHNKLNRDIIIKKVASLVGTNHSVDLKNYDALILVNVLKNICGISVVGPDYDRLKRYNLQEIFDPTPEKHVAEEKHRENLQIADSTTRAVVPTDDATNTSDLPEVPRNTEVEDAG
ncbi:hypothetical protein KVT40_001337 [Elsinoe batatas]|uniref:THUMP domain-containing protein n=1 Tax=Elsinoe batatas TaxID=2601811 RepID=A0A8K0L7U5_9PEZI|nr:hypothetical protein KVT40_001337 [Elsinoe batatas]